SHTYITDPSEALKLNQKVTVKVMEVDVARKRISLSIKQAQEAPPRKERSQQNRPQQHNKDRKKEPDMANMNMNDALSMLKKKFGK
ncbi:MAG: S1 RNA-binding domain-containing protein, partial [Bacteroidetes bacterium]|nr:S1 RNA-binding domain-containing protein [Bacteroidota bacterium]